MKWTIENTKLLIDYHKSGLNSFEISNKLSLSRKQITNKLRLLGFKTDITKSFKHLIKKEICLNCKTEFEYNKNKKLGRKFCSSKCCAQFNNCKKDSNGKIIIKDKEINCLFCDKILEYDNKTKRQTKFCSYACQAQIKIKIIFEKIESGDLSLPSRQYKNYLINKYGEKCMECGWCEINPASGKVPIELEHIDGNSENNNLDNLKLLCPNHHSLTPTYKALNKGNGRYIRMVRYNSGKSF